MVVERKWGEAHINKSLKQIDSSTWLIGQDLVLRRLPQRSGAAPSSRAPSSVVTWNDATDNSSYTLTKASAPLPTTTAIDSPYVDLIHEAGDASAIWSIGGYAICKVRYTEPGVTPESATLNFVEAKKPSFETPKVLHHAFGSDRSYLFMERLQGRTLDKAWPTLTDHWRTHYVNAVANACEEMAEWEGSTFAGVDKQYIPECYLAGEPEDFSKLRTGCEAIGMPCFPLVFHHADLGPTNIIVEEEPRTGKIGIIDFEISGYFPKGWIRTKFRLSAGMDLSASASDNPTVWRAAVQKVLGQRGFDEYADAWAEDFAKQHSA